jgi:inorganic pyrophosphatase
MHQPSAFIGNSNNVNVIIETPKGTGSKYAYDPALDLFKLKKVLPAGIVFPYHFGFIPKTHGQDGGPLDVLVLMDEPSYPGCLIECRIVGVIEIEETKNRQRIRNDRFIAAALESRHYDRQQNITDLSQHKLREILNFLSAYTALSKKNIKHLGNRGSKVALENVRKHVVEV